MLRVGLTGELGSGKSTVARMLAVHGAIVLSSDEIARAMMEPGEPVYRSIVDRFGPGVVLPDGRLNRPELARLAFDPAHPRVEELNAVIHPAVLAEQERVIAEVSRSEPYAIVVVESALIFTTKHAGSREPWRDRFNCILCVTAPEALKVQRYAARVGGTGGLTPERRFELETEARRRLDAQRISAEQAAQCLIVQNTDDLSSLEEQVNRVWETLQATERGQRLFADL